MWQTTSRAYARIVAHRGLRLALALQARHVDFAHFKRNAAKALAALAPEEDMTNIDWVHLRDLLRREE